MDGLELSGVNVWLGEQHILKDVNLSVAQGECVALLGPSGCGKTTTLRTVAGFIQPQMGEVLIARKSTRGLPPNKRNVGLVFQDYALFPHMTIGENIGYGLRMRHVAAAEIAVRVHDALEMVQLEHVRDRFPANLSGGQRQRVALARALVIRPDILLLDEPLGALDRKLRDQMQVELKQLQRRLGITTIIVTHDQEEALSLADRVAVMFNGEIKEIGEPARLYERPASREVMDFLGSTNLFPGTIVNQETGTLTVEGPEGLLLNIKTDQSFRDADILLGIRPEHIKLVPLEDKGGDCVTGSVVECVYKGGLVEVHTRLSDGKPVKISSTALEASQFNLERTGARVNLRISPEHVQIFDAH
ncbi:ABC transporter ATP-binding protein [Castellaniella sp. GW247-6E4]|uniref:ABC transporter ATP-binding protein n=1 Tax=Castellaniella sp. GW247-6E4 TaxID=3140380 RepID=UPI003315D30D